MYVKDPDDHLLLLARSNYFTWCCYKDTVTTNYTGLPVEIQVSDQGNRSGSYFDIIVSFTKMTVLWLGALYVI